MTTQEFLSRVLPHLPAPGPFGQDSCYFTLALNGSGQTCIRRQMTHTDFASIEQFCTEYSAQGFNTYFALGRYAQFTGGRKAANVAECRAVWADIDAGKANSKYKDAREALVAVDTFVKATGLMPTIIVSSGAGLHVYWTFTKSIKAEVWKQIAAVFHQLCKQEGLDVDPTRAEDLASVLRLPSTIHIKSGKLVRVVWSAPYDLDPTVFVKGIAAHLKTQPAQPRTTRTTGAQQAAMAAVGFVDAPTARAERVVRECPQMLTAGLSSYPQWFAAMSVLRSCVDGLEWAHKISALDPKRYDAQATEDKFYSATQGAPCLCETFSRINPSLCLKCQHRGRVKTPIQIAKLPMAEQIHQAPHPHVQTADEAMAAVAGVVTNLPESPTEVSKRITLNHPAFAITPQGIVWRVMVKDAGGSWTTKEQVICTSRLYYKYAVYQVIDGQPKRSHVFEVEHPNGKTEELLFVIDRDLSNQAIMHWFANGNMFPVNGVKSGVFLEFINAYLQAVVNSSTSTELPTLDEFGWQDYVDPASKENIRGFVTGRGIVTDTGLHSVRFGTRAAFLENELKAKGTLENWKYIPQMYKTLDQKVGQLAMCMSFAAPFMCFGSGEATNGILSLWSSASGLGKTHVLRFAASVWGNPYEQFISREASSVARTRRMSILNNLPVFMDEITDVADEDIYSLAYTIVGGKEKDKLRSSGDSYVQTGKWKTLTFTSSNRSLKDAISRRAGDSDATLLRIMEYECDFKSYEHVPDVNRYINTCIALLKENYGWAGPELMYQIMQRPDRLHVLTNECNHWIAKNHFRNNERFMSYPLAIALKVGRWCVEFGLLDYDMDALENWVLTSFVPANRRATTSNAPDFKDILGTYLMDRQPNTLVVTANKRLPKQRDPGVQGMPDSYIISAPKDSVRVRVERDDRCLVFARSDFNYWCRNRNVSANTVLAELGDQGMAAMESVRDLAKGVSWMPAARVRCVVMQGDTLAKLGYRIDSPNGDSNEQA